MSKAAAQAALPAGVVELHRRILGRFLATGAAPQRPKLAAWIAGLDLADDPMAVLLATDLVHTDPASGAVTTAYPFSGSRHATSSNWIRRRRCTRCARSTLSVSR